MRRRLRNDLTAALKARDRIAVSALRSAIAAIDNTEAVDATSGQPNAPSSEHIAGATAGVGSSDVERRELSHAELIAIVRGQVEERIQAAGEYERLGRSAEAERLRAEAELLRNYLPAA